MIIRSAFTVSGTADCGTADLEQNRQERAGKMMEISKADWKLFREKVPEWQEHYMEQLVKGYINLLSSLGNASDHFWELEKRIKRDKKHPGVILEMNKSDAIWDIALLVKQKVISLDDLQGFSTDLVDAVKLILSR